MSALDELTALLCRLQPHRHARGGCGADRPPGPRRPRLRRAHPQREPSPAWRCHRLCYCYSLLAQPTGCGQAPPTSLGVGALQSSHVGCPTPVFCLCPSLMLTPRLHEPLFRPLRFLSAPGSPSRSLHPHLFLRILFGLYYITSKPTFTMATCTCQCCHPSLSFSPQAAVSSPPDLGSTSAESPPRLPLQSP